MQSSCSPIRPSPPLPCPCHALPCLHPCIPDRAPPRLVSALFRCPPSPPRPVQSHSPLLYNYCSLALTVLYRCHSRALDCELSSSGITFSARLTSSHLSDTFLHPLAWLLHSLSLSPLSDSGPVSWSKPLQEAHSISPPSDITPQYSRFPPEGRGERVSALTQTHSLPPLPSTCIAPVYHHALGLSMSGS